MFWVYVLQCRDGSYYTGHTDDLEKRFSQHRAGEIPDCYTATRLPVRLVFQQTHATREEALGAERQIKGWGRAKKRALISGDWEGLSRLSRSRDKGDGD
ncbi:MAG: hypothetical protein CMN28_10845 [Salinisphaeraceae bacterium]|nr:hypothetical protein [Salinisphaeraceae bacterium]